MSAEASPGLLVESAEGAARRAGLAAGDRLLEIDGRPAVDVLDLEFAAADERFAVAVERGCRRFTAEVLLDRGESHGLTLAHGIGVPPRECDNACSFCFVDQVPPGLRPSLSLKDDDYRLSFLTGTFTTLSNLTGGDEQRIAHLRLSPLYVSLHAWDDEVRAALMGPCAHDSRERLLRLAAQGIEFHLQIVLCPGVNDGPLLRESLQRLADIPQVLSIGVVPVSLATETRLRRVSVADADAALGIVEGLERERRAAGLAPSAEAADELYLSVGRTPPPASSPEQYENGIGIVAAFLAETAAVALPADVRVALLSGTLAEPVLAEAARILEERGGAAAVGRRPFRARSYVVENRTFGPHVTVTGLLGGRDLLRRLGEEPLADGERLLAPRAFLPTDPGVTIDDVTEAELQRACGGRLVIAESLGEALAAAAGAHEGP